MLVEEGQVRDQVFHDEGVRQRIDSGFLACISRDAAQASERVDTVNVHCARAANAFSA